MRFARTLWQMIVFPLYRNRGPQYSCQAFFQEIAGMHHRQFCYAGVAALTWIVWDVLINLDDEIEFIWRRPKTWLNPMYVFIRYIPVIQCGLLLALWGGGGYSTHTCKALVIAQTVVLEVVTLMAEAILVVRLYFLFNQNKALLCLISTTLVIEIVARIVIWVLLNPRMKYTPHCLLERSIPAYSIILWIMSLVFQGLLFILSIIKLSRSLTWVSSLHSFVSDIKLSRSLTWVSSLHSFVSELITDHISAFLAIAASHIVATIVGRVLSVWGIEMGYLWTLTVMSLSGRKIILSAKVSSASISVFHASAPYNQDSFSLHFGPPTEPTTVLTCDRSYADFSTEGQSCIV
ncbi:hypothetical protein BDW22DRAFT_1365591 [Trametopsis cervina]|nr:hypothetical protein BDW22DRAFT_1365591 [Trametopsis cervina]